MVTKWGRVNINSKCIPKTIDHLPATETLVKIIKCKCNLDCATLQYICWKNVSQCSSLCGACQEKECANLSTFNYLTQNKELSDSSDSDVELFVKQTFLRSSHKNAFSENGCFPKSCYAQQLFYSYGENP